MAIGTDLSVPEKYKYQNGFGSYHECVFILILSKLYAAKIPVY